VIVQWAAQHLIPAANWAIAHHAPGPDLFVLHSRREVREFDSPVWVTLPFGLATLPCARTRRDVPDSAVDWTMSVRDLRLPHHGPPAHRSSAIMPVCFDEHHRTAMVACLPSPSMPRWRQRTIRPG
jgi:hypothetical protein